MVSRRELLVSFLGAAACRRTTELPPIPGSFVDRVVETGHLLRGPAPLPLAPEVTHRCEVLVVGAGAAGLSAAWRLRGAGVEDLLVVEVDEALGGTARSGRNEVSAFPWGAHYLPAPLTTKGPVARLVNELGLVTGVSERGAPIYAEQALIHEPDERIFYRGLWYEGLYLRAGASKEDLEQLRRFEAAMNQFAAARDGKGRKAFDLPIERGSDDAEWTSLDRTSMAEWMASQGFTSKRLLWMIDYACRDDYGATAADTSAWVGIGYFASRQTGDEKNDGYLSWPEGNGRLIRHLAGAVGERRLRANLLVHTLEPADGPGWQAHALDAVTRAPLRIAARQVIFAGPRFVAGHVVAPWRTERPSFLDAFQYSPWVVANLTVSAPPRSRGAPLAWDNVLYDSRSLGYVVATHQAERADEHGKTVLTWYYALDGHDVVAERSRLLSAACQDWQAIALADLRPAHYGLASQVERLDVMRWGHAMIRPRPGFVWGEARRAAQASLGGSLHFAHTDLGGLALFEEASWHGVRAAEQVLEGLGRSADSWLG